jgi:hypothetical protein
MKNKLIVVLSILSIGLMQCKDTTKTTKETVEETVEITEMEKNENEWEILFDGTSLDQWRGYLAEDMYPEWVIEDGTLVFMPGKEGGKNIITKNTYTNFVLSLEWKVSEIVEFSGVYMKIKNTLRPI